MIQDRAVVAFARRWGVLGLCEHGLPYQHRTPWCTPSCKEAFQHWKDIAVYFEAMRRIGAALYRGKVGEDTDWGVVTEGRYRWRLLSYEPQFLTQFLKTAPYRGVRRAHFTRPILGALMAEMCPDVSAERLEKGIDDLLEVIRSYPIQEPVDNDEGREALVMTDAIVKAQTFDIFNATDDAPFGTIRTRRVYYMALIEQLIGSSGLQPRFYWSGGAWNIDMDSQAYSNIPAILTAQLMLEVGTAKAMIKCTTCPRWYIPRRNQRKYCDRCGIRAAWRVSKRNKRKSEEDK